MNILCERIKKLRELNKISQTELGKKVNVGKTTISNYETGYSKPDNDTLVMLADALNCSADYLLGRTDSPHVVVKQIAPGIEIGQNMYSEKVYTKENIDNFLKYIQNQIAQNKKKE